MPSTPLRLRQQRQAEQQQRRQQQRRGRLVQTLWSQRSRRMRQGPRRPRGSLACGMRLRAGAACCRCGPCYASCVRCVGPAGAQAGMHWSAGICGWKPAGTTCPSPAAPTSAASYLPTHPPSATLGTHPGRPLLLPPALPWACTHAPAALPPYPLQRYIGQCNLQTDIKEACFLGCNDELVAAGSDDGRVFIFRTATGECIRQELAPACFALLTCAVRRRWDVRFSQVGGGTSP